jgi:asparagine synthase (glutamine-hydrolysing)
MCGICGQYNFKAHDPVIREDIEKMTKTLVHRGPDDEGYYISGPVGLGFRRLSIIDLQGGHQPMFDSDLRVCIVFNGEIYNFQELRGELLGFGHIFQTKCDTEVIIAGYKQWGEDVFNHLNGMFGLAIWDKEKKKLIVARDAMGIKSVYYKLANGVVYFGSEVRAILACQENKPNVDPVALNLFLRYRYTPSPLTLYHGIKKLAPGTMLVFENGNYTIKRWYTFKPKPFSPKKKPEEAREELLTIYKSAIKRQLISDVPVGLLLSGGIDSGLLLGLMNLQGQNWPTFTVGYGSQFKDDELHDAAETAKIYNSRHVSVELTRDLFERSLSNIIHCLEEPVATSSIVPMYFVCQRAREDVKVALIGQGPDELFGGYKRHLGVRYGNFWRALPSVFRKPISAMVKSLPRNEAMKRAVNSLDTSSRMERYQQVFSILTGPEIDQLFQKDVLPLGSGNKVIEFWQDFEPLMENLDELGGFQFIELRSSLPDELLMFGDKLSMAHGLEVRVPYLDREIVEYTERLHANFKVRYGQRKWLHRQVCKQFMPAEILNRKKRGFATNVVDDWFYGSLSSKFEEYLSDPSSRMYELLNFQSVQSLLKNHKEKRANHYKILFSLIAFEEWLRIF